MSDSKQISAIFNELLAETHKYVPPDERQTLIYGGYGQLIASVTPDIGFSDPLLQQSLNIAVHGARLGLHAVYLASSMVYYPFLTKRLSASQVTQQFGKPGSIMVSALDSLVILGHTFEKYLPWIQESIVGTATLKTGRSNNRRKELEEALETRKRSKREEQALARSTIAFLAISRSPEVAVLKSLDRLCLLKNLAKFTIESNLQRKIAQDALDIFAPVIDALGVWSVKSQLEDMALKVLQPEDYAAIARDLSERLQERQARTERAIQAIHRSLINEGMQGRITGRPKHIYGIYRKKLDGKSISEINDVLGVRVVVNTQEECYMVLSILTQSFELARGVYEEGKLFRDWIVHPKPNGYQSIHTTIMFEGKQLEVQVRTQAMHELAEYGAAAHWVYRKAGNSPEQQKKYQTYVAQVADFRQLFERAQELVG